MVAGVTLAYSNTSTDTTFTSGQSDIDEFTIAPYFGILFDSEGIPAFLSAGFAVNYSNLEISQFRNTVGTRITADTDTDSLFFVALERV